MRPVQNLKQGHRKTTDLAVLCIVLAAGASAGWYFVLGTSTTGNANNENVLPDLLTGQPPTRGLQNAPVSIVEFGDFQCTTCSYWFRNYEQQVLQNLLNTGKAKLVWKDFDYIGPDSTVASEAAYAAGEQGKFWEYYDLLYSNQGAANNGWASINNLDKFAIELGLNMTQFNESVGSGKYMPIIQSNFELGNKLGITSVPTFFIVGSNGKSMQIIGAQPYIVFEMAVDSVLKQ
jgi:protein-disulfide isomerase